MSADEKRRLEDIQRREIVTSKNLDFRLLRGWGEIVNKRSIRAFSAGRDGKPQGDYERTFRQVRVTVRAAAEDDRLGSLFLSKVDERHWLDEDGGKDDCLSADLRVRAEVLEALVRTIRETGEVPALTLHLDALLHQTEVERALAEPYHRQEYAILEDAFAPVSMTHLVWDEASRTAPSAEDEDAADEVRPVATERPAVAASSDVGRRIRGLAFAVWGLAAAVVLAALLR